MRRYLAGVATGLVLAAGMAGAQVDVKPPVAWRKGGGTEPLPVIEVNSRVLAKCDGMDEALRILRGLRRPTPATP